MFYACRFDIAIQMNLDRELDLFFFKSRVVSRDGVEMVLFDDPHESGSYFEEMLSEFLLKKPFYAQKLKTNQMGIVAFPVPNRHHPDSFSSTLDFCFNKAKFIASTLIPNKRTLLIAVSFGFSIDDITEHSPCFPIDDQFMGVLIRGEGGAGFYSKDFAYDLDAKINSVLGSMT